MYFTIQRVKIIISYFKLGNKELSQAFWTVLNPEYDNRLWRAAVVLIEGASKTEMSFERLIAEMEGQRPREASSILSHLIAPQFEYAIGALQKTGKHHWTSDLLYMPGMISVALHSNEPGWNYQFVEWKDEIIVLADSKGLMVVLRWHGIAPKSMQMHLSSKSCEFLVKSDLNNCWEYKLFAIHPV